MKETTFQQRFNMALTRAGVPHGHHRVREATKLLGSSREATRQWVKGIVEPRPANMLQIAERLCVSPGWLMSGEGSMVNGYDIQPEITPEFSDTLTLTGWPNYAERALYVTVSALVGFLIGLGLLKAYEILFEGAPVLVGG